jgi:hypothetical protein
VRFLRWERALADAGLPTVKPDLAGRVVIPLGAGNRADITILR